MKSTAATTGIPDAFRAMVPDSFPAQVVVLYLGARLLSAIVIIAVAPYQTLGPSMGESVGYLDMANLWDARWFQEIATTGYPQEIPSDPATGDVLQNAWAFYPLFPMVARALMSVTGLPFQVVGPSVALAAGTGSAVIIGYLMRRRLGEAASLATVAVLAVFPSSPTLQIAYSDSMTLLVVVSALLALDRGNWLTAGGFIVIAGLSRPTTPPLGIALAAAGWSRWRTHGPLRRQEWVRLGVAALAVPVAISAWPLIVALSVGNITALTDTYGAWQISGSYQLFGRWIEGAASPGTWVYLTAFTVPLVLAAAGPWAARLGPVMRGWCVGYAAFLAATTGPVAGVLRHMLLLFPLGALAVGAGRVDPGDRAIAMRTVVLGGALLIGQIWWVWTLLRYVPPMDVPP